MNTREKTVEKKTRKKHVFSQVFQRFPKILPGNKKCWMAEKVFSEDNTFKRFWPTFNCTTYRAFIEAFIWALLSPLELASFGPTLLLMGLFHPFTRRSDILLKNYSLEISWQCQIKANLCCNVVQYLDVTTNFLCSKIIFYGCSSSRDKHRRAV